MFFLLGLTALAQPSVIDVSETAPFPMVFVAPLKSSPISISEVSKTVAAVLKAHTDLSLAVVEDSVIRGCDGEFPCMAARIRSEPGLLSAPLFVVLSVVPDDPRGHLLSAVLIDAATQRELASLIDRPVTDEAHCRRVLEEAFGTSFKPALEEAGRWEPYAELTITVGSENATLTWNEHPLGVIGGAGVRVVGLGAGDHVIEVSDAKGSAAVRKLHLDRGQSSELELVLESDPRGRQAILIAGIGVGVVGLASLILAVQYAARYPERIQCQPCPGHDFATIEQTLRSPSDGNRGTILALPLGYSLLAGGGMLVADSIFAEDETLLWVLAGVALALAGASYGISAALD